MQSHCNHSDCVHALCTSSALVLSWGLFSLLLPSTYLYTCKDKQLCIPMTHILASSVCFWEGSWMGCRPGKDTCKVPIPLTQPAQAKKGKKALFQLNGVFHRWLFTILTHKNACFFSEYITSHYHQHLCNKQTYSFCFVLFSVFGDVVCNGKIVLTFYYLLLI